MSSKISKRVDSKSQKRLSVASKCLAIVLSPDENEPGKTPTDLSGKVILDDFKLRNKTCYWNPALVESIQNLEYKGYVEPDTLLVGGEDIHLENLRTAWGRRVLNDPAHFRITRIGDVGGIKMQVIPQTQFIPLPEILCLVILDLNSKQVMATLDVIHTRLTQCFCDLQSPGVQVLYDTLGTLIRQRKVFHNGSGYFVVTPDTYRLPTDDPQQTYPMMHYNPMYIPVPANQPKALMTRSISCQVSLANQPQNIPQAPPTEGLPNQGTAPEESKLKEVYKLKEEIYTEGTEILQSVVNDKPRLSRSQSARRTKDKPGKEERDSTKAVSRCSSMRGDRGCRGGENRDINLANSNINKVKDKGEKKSLLSKIFGRKKKKKSEKQQQQQQEDKKVETPAMATTSSGEYATFSAQFPPPEWQWYREQIEKQERTSSWLNQQRHPDLEAHSQITDQFSVQNRNQIPFINKQDGSSSSDYVCPQQLFPRQQIYEARRQQQKIVNPSKLSPFTEHEEEHYCQIDPRFEESLRNLRASTLPPEGYYDGNLMEKRGELNHGGAKNCAKAATLPGHLPQNTEENHHIHRRHSESHGHRRRHEVGDRARVRRHSGDRKQLLVQADQCYNYSHESEDTVSPTQPSFPYHSQQKHTVHHISEPLYSSTPRGLQRDPGETVHNNTVDELFKEKVQERVHRSKKSSRHRHRHSIGYHSNYPKNDISYEYHGKLPRKSSNRALSRDSGVNCIGLSQGQSKVKGQEKDGRSTPIECITKRSHSEGKKQPRNPKQNNADVKQADKKHSNIGNNEVVCVVEINSCVPPEAREMITPVTPPDEFVPHSVQEEDEGMEGDVDSFIEESEQSYDTVIDSRTRNAKRVSDLCDQTKNINLGDSGFSSPRNHDSLQDYQAKMKTRCDEGSNQSSSSGGRQPKQSHLVQDSLKCHSKDPSLYERSDLIVLNNMKDVHRDQNLLSNHVMNQVSLYPSNQTTLPPEAVRLGNKSPIPFNFHFDGDYQVVGVV